MPRTDENVRPLQRIISASIGALLTSLTVTPFDVIKTRMQVQAAQGLTAKCADEYRRKSVLSNASKLLNPSAATRNNGSIPSSIGNRGIGLQRWYIMSNGLMDQILPAKELERAISMECRNTYFRNSVDATLKIVRLEGLSHLYTGLSVTLWMAIPATVLYFSTYDMLRNFFVLSLGAHNFDDRYPTVSNMVPSICGASARTFSAVVISPLELLRTQMMARTIDRKLGVLEATRLNIRSEGILALWKGLVPTLWRDVPFSAVYWAGYEYLKDRILQRTSKTSNREKDAFIVAFASGALSGAFSTVLTQPFDVLKTRQQSILIGVNNPNHSPLSPRIVKPTLRSVSKDILENEGMKGFFSGLPARMGKVPLACAIMISVYEAGKLFLSHLQ